MLRTVLLALALLSGGLALAPAASADTCTVWDPELETLVCGPILVTLCLAQNAADFKNAKDHVRRCTTILYP